MTSGEIINVEDCGTVILVFLATQGRVLPIPFDHRPFGWLLAGEGCSAEDLIGRNACYDGNAVTFD